MEKIRRIELLHIDNTRDDAIAQRASASECQNYLDMIMVDDTHLSIITGELSVKFPVI